MKVRAAAGRLQTLPPIVLRFQTDTPIYPLRISAISPGVVDIRVYCFRERIARIAGYEDRGAYALREDFRRLCPALSEEVADVPWPVFYSKVSEVSHWQGVAETQFRRGTMRELP